MRGHADLTQLLWLIFLVVAILVMLKALGVRL
jgi:hypothetical protein